MGFLSFKETIQIINENNTSNILYDHFHFSVCVRLCVYKKPSIPEINVSTIKRHKVLSPFFSSHYICITLGYVEDCSDKKNFVSSFLRSKITIYICVNNIS